MEITYTTAPESYDGFGTETVTQEIHVFAFGRKRLFRKVTTPSEHVEWQRQRYGSGMHAALTEGGFLALSQPS